MRPPTGVKRTAYDTRLVKALCNSSSAPRSSKSDSASSTISCLLPLRPFASAHKVCNSAGIATTVWRGAEEELHSAFTNLVSNAVRYTPVGGRITLRWFADARGAYFQVEDTGEGIAPQHIPRLTARFYRVDVGRSRQTGGTGLGHAIVKHVLERHQAQLRVESELGRGSCFSCDFPASLIVRQ